MDSAPLYLKPSKGDLSSCAGRCGEGYSREAPCHCDYSCLHYMECCHDYKRFCTEELSCKGRCFETFVRGRECDCDADCEKFGKCCSDYQKHCEEALTTKSSSSSKTAPLVTKTTAKRSSKNSKKRKPKKVVQSHEVMEEHSESEKQKSSSSSSSSLSSTTIRKKKASARNPSEKNQTNKIKNKNNRKVKDTMKEQDSKNKRTSSRTSTSDEIREISEEIGSGLDNVGTRPAPTAKHPDRKISGQGNKDTTAAPLSEESFSQTPASQPDKVTMPFKMNTTKTLSLKTNVQPTTISMAKISALTNAALGKDTVMTTDERDLTTLGKETITTTEKKDATTTTATETITTTDKKVTTIAERETVTAKTVTAAAKDTVKTTDKKDTTTANDEIILTPDEKDLTTKKDTTTAYREIVTSATTATTAAARETVTRAPQADTTTETKDTLATTGKKGTTTVDKETVMTIDEKDKTADKKGITTIAAVNIITTDEKDTIDKATTTASRATAAKKSVMTTAKLDTTAAAKKTQTTTKQTPTAAEVTTVAIELTTADKEKTVDNRQKTTATEETTTEEKKELTTVIKERTTEDSKGMTTAAKEKTMNEKKEISTVLQETTTSDTTEITAADKEITIADKRERTTVTRETTMANKKDAVTRDTSTTNKKEVTTATKETATVDKKEKASDDKQATTTGKIDTTASTVTKETLTVSEEVSTTAKGSQERPVSPTEDKPGTTVTQIPPVKATAKPTIEPEKTTKSAIQITATPPINLSTSQPKDFPETKVHFETTKETSTVTKRSTATSISKETTETKDISENADTADTTTQKNTTQFPTEKLQTSKIIVSPSFAQKPANHPVTPEQEKHIDNSSPTAINPMTLPDSNFPRRNTENLKETPVPYEGPNQNPTSSKQVNSIDYPAISFTTSIVPLRGTPNPNGNDENNRLETITKITRTTTKSNSAIPQKQETTSHGITTNTSIDLVSDKEITKESPIAMNTNTSVKHKIVSSTFTAEKDMHPTSTLPSGFITTRTEERREVTHFPTKIYSSISYSTKAPERSPAIHTDSKLQDKINTTYKDEQDKNLCNGKPADGIVALPNGTLAVFRGHYYWLLDSARQPTVSPRKITEGWGIPSPIDTVFSRCNCDGKTFFFKGSQYWRFTNDAKDVGYPKQIAKGFAGLSGKIVAVLSVAQHNKRPESVYFFKRGGSVQHYIYNQEPAKKCKKKVYVRYPSYTPRAVIKRRRFERAIRSAIMYRTPVMYHTQRINHNPSGILHHEVKINSYWRGFPKVVHSAISIPNYQRPDGYDYYVFSRDQYYNVDVASRIARSVTSRTGQTVSKDWYKCPKDDL
ncbi:cbp/p300-interacting transactivator 4 [Platysternon megacephalum]|uniref:Cbp/p300-interacting transactivator 4 n=1 Tax=Platysternon megacephalum TaxID=55544 RepID=A0A4D9DT78_9SAUR|nr:cbp/p300-interacting transactivator 4 [Platysternon megacephalum]